MTGEYTLERLKQVGFQDVSLINENTILINDGRSYNYLILYVCNNLYQGYEVVNYWCVDDFNHYFSIERANVGRCNK